MRRASLATTTWALVVVFALCCQAQDGHEQHLVEPLPAGVAEPIQPPETTFPLAPGALTLVELVDLAMTNNPTLIQAAAQIQASYGEAYQAGLLPNPNLGYAGEQMGIEGTAGELQGGFFSQEFVTGGKLRLSRQKYLERARIAESYAVAQQQRVVNDVKLHFYRALAACELVKVHEELVANAEDRVTTAKEMFNLGQVNQPELLDAEVDLQRRRLEWIAARNDHQRAWYELAAVVGVPELEKLPLAGHLEPESCPIGWDEAIALVMSSSPEIEAAWREVRHDEITVRRERVQPIPNLTVEANVGKNFETNNTVAGVAAGINLPLFDRNQGTVQQAQADLRQSRAEARRMALELQSKLAMRYRDYHTSWQYVQDYSQVMLPKANQAQAMLRESYFARRAPWMQVLDAQETYLELRADYVKQLLAYREADVEIRGLLLTGGLERPIAPLSRGHIDSVPKPR